MTDLSFLHFFFCLSFIFKNVILCVLVGNLFNDIYQLFKIMVAIPDSSGKATQPSTLIRILTNF